MLKKVFFTLIFLMLFTANVFAVCRITRSDYQPPKGMKIGRDDGQAGLRSMSTKIERNLPWPGIHTIQTGIEFG